MRTSLSSPGCARSRVPVPTGCRVGPFRVAQRLARRLAPGRIPWRGSPPPVLSRALEAEASGSAMRLSSPKRPGGSPRVAEDVAPGHERHHLRRVRADGCRKQTPSLLPPRTCGLQARQPVDAPGVLELPVLGHLLGAFALGGDEELVAGADVVHARDAEAARARDPVDARFRRQRQDVLARRSSSRGALMPTGPFL
jgi:hypothetical protein